MAEDEVTKAVLANRTKQVIIWGCCCHSVVLASDYLQAAAVKPVHTAHHWLSERPRLRCTRQVTRAPRLSLSRNTIMHFQTGKRYKTIRR